MPHLTLSTDRFFENYYCTGFILFLFYILTKYYLYSNSFPEFSEEKLYTVIKFDENLFIVWIGNELPLSGKQEDSCTGQEM